MMLFLSSLLFMWFSRVFRKGSLFLVSSIWICLRASYFSFLSYLSMLVWTICSAVMLAFAFRRLVLWCQVRLGLSVRPFGFI